MFKTVLFCRIQAFVFVATFFFHHTLCAQWDYLPLPEAPVTASARIGDRLFAGVTGGGVYFSEDFGHSWTLAPGSTTGGFTIIEATGPYVYVTSSSASGDNIYRSTNGGTSFTFFETIANQGAVDKVIRGDTMWYINANKSQLKRAIYAPTYSNVAVLTLSSNSIIDVEKIGDYLVAATLSGMRWSTDAGASWQVSTDNVPVNSGSELVVRNGTVFCYDQQRHLFRSDDGGAHWLELPFFEDNFTSFSINGFSTDEDALLVLSNINSANHRAWRSDDAGLSWQPVYSEMATVQQGFTVPGAKMLWTSTGFLRTTDGGGTWYTANNSLNPNTLLGFYRSPAGRWVLGHQKGNSGVYFSDNGTDFRFIPMTYGTLREMTGRNNRVAINATLPPELLYSLDGGETWTRRDYPTDPISVTALDWYGNRLFFRTYEGTLHTYEPTSDTWTDVPAPGITHCVAAFDGYLFAGGAWGIKMSADDGQSWHDPVYGLPPGYQATRIFTAAGKVFVCGDSYGGLYASSDYGLSWYYAGTGINNNEDAKMDNITGAGDQLFARTANGAFYISDDGLQWYPAQLPSGTSFYFNGAMSVFGDSLYLFDRNSGFNVFVRRPVNSFYLEKLFGTVYVDANQNGVRDSSESCIVGLPVFLKNESDVTLTDSLGRYTLALDSPGDTLRVSLPFIAAEAQPGFYFVDQGAQGLDFGIFSDIPDASTTMFGGVVPRPGFAQSLHLVVKNNGVEALHDVLVHWLPDPHWQLLSTDQPVTEVADTLVWTVDSLPVLGVWYTKISVRLDSTTALATPLKDVVWLYSPADNFPANDRDTFHQRVLASYDPNDKAVDRNQFTPAQAAERPVLKYQIRFQNTGNFPAEFVRIRDTFPAELDPTSFRLLAASHPLEVQIKPPGYLDFFFNHIQLPDSISNEAGSHGFVAFEMNLKPGLSAGDSVANRAAIYFDYNAPVITNAAITRVVDSIVTSISQWVAPGAGLNIYPNPAREWARVEWPATLSGPAKLWLADVHGRVVRQFQPRQAGPFEMALTGLPTGDYWLFVAQQGRIFAGKLIVY